MLGMVFCEWDPVGCWVWCSVSGVPWDPWGVGYGVNLTVIEWAWGGR